MLRCTEQRLGGAGLDDFAAAHHHGLVANAAHHAQRRDREKLAESIRELKEEVVLAEAKLIELRRKLAAEERALANLQ